MRNLIKTVLAVFVAVMATAAAPEDSFARGGGGGGRGGGGGGRGGGRGGSGRGGKAGAKGVGNKGGKGSDARAGLRGKSPSDYLDAVQREDAEAARPDFLFEARFASLERTGADERDEALRAARDKASTERRDASESGAHPL